MCWIMKDLVFMVSKFLNYVFDIYRYFNAKGNVNTLGPLWTAHNQLLIWENIYLLNTRISFLKLSVSYAWKESVRSCTSLKDR